MRMKLFTLVFYSILLTVTLMLLVSSGVSASQEELAPGRKMAKQATKTKELWITADHSKHEILQQEFNPDRKSPKPVFHAIQRQLPSFTKQFTGPGWILSPKKTSSWAKEGCLSTTSESIFKATRLVAHHAMQVTDGRVRISISLIRQKSTV